jgi:exopolysaccharide production protein ExoZ
MTTAPAKLPDPQMLAADSSRKATIRSLQVLRFVAAFIVVVFHSYGAMAGHVPDPSDLLGRAFGLGASGVHIFFVISGFVMVFTAYGGRTIYGPRAFLERRVLRIYPIYWLLAFVYFGAHLLLGSPYSLSLPEIFGALILWPGQSSKIIGPGWTLSYEMYFYLCFAIALWLPKARAVPALTAFFVASIAVGALAHPQAAPLMIMSDSLLLEFLAGCWIGRAYLNGRQLGPRLAALSIAASLGLFAAGVLFGYDRVPSVVSWGIPSVLLVSGALSLERHFANPVGGFFAGLGDSSYFLYLAHILLIHLIVVETGVAARVNDPTAALLAPVIAIVVTALAALGYRLIERPMLKRLKSVFISRTPARRAEAVS